MTEQQAAVWLNKCSQYTEKPCSNLGHTEFLFLLDAGIKEKQVFNLHTTLYGLLLSLVYSVCVSECV